MGLAVIVAVLYAFGYAHGDCVGRWSESMLVECPQPGAAVQVARVQDLPPAPQVRRFGVDFNAPLPHGFAAVPPRSPVSPWAPLQAPEVMP